MLEIPSDLQTVLLQEITEALERLRRRSTNIHHVLMESTWHYKGQVKATWTFGKKNRLNYNKNLQHAQGEWKVLDETVVIAQLGGFFSAAFPGLR